MQMYCFLRFDWNFRASSGTKKLSDDTRNYLFFGEPSTELLFKFTLLSELFQNLLKNLEKRLFSLFEESIKFQYKFTNNLKKNRLVNRKTKH